LTGFFLYVVNIFGHPFTDAASPLGATRDHFDLDQVSKVPALIFLVNFRLAADPSTAYSSAQAVWPIGTE
jgi:hypothetical protein